MAKKSRKKTRAKSLANKTKRSAKNAARTKSAKRRIRPASRTQASAKKAKKRTLTPRPRAASKSESIPQKVVKAFNAVVDTMTEASHMRDTMKGPPGPEDG